MPKVICPCVDCKYNGNNHRCKADYLRFKFRNMATVNEGRVNTWVCDRYELSKQAKQLEEDAKRLIENMNDKYRKD